MISKRNSFWTFIIAATLIACGVSKEPTLKNTEDVISILFVGNSLTYTNNLPKLVEDYEASKAVKVKTTMLAKPNYALIDHWLNGQVQSIIATGEFDYVIVQQGPSSQAEGRAMLIDDGKKYSALCKEYDTKLVYFMVWPSLKYFQTFDDVVRSHEIAANKNNALLCPVGKLWQDYIATIGDYSYYGEDGFHPSLKGSKVAAESIVNTLFIE